MGNALAGVALIQSNLPHPLFRIAGLILAPLFVIGSLEFVGPVQARRLEAGRHAGAAGLHRLVPMAAGVSVCWSPPDPAPPGQRF